MVPLGNTLERWGPTERSTGFHAPEQCLVDPKGGRQRRLGLALGFANQSQPAFPPAGFSGPPADFSSLLLRQDGSPCGAALLPSLPAQRDSSWIFSAHTQKIPERSKKHKEKFAISLDTD